MPLARRPQAVVGGSGFGGFAEVNPLVGE